ncbi:MAG: GIY-YIG nuclease family protein, partial [Candidatus Paceibacterota bacterium]
MNYHVYIIQCVDRSLYTGIAKDIEKRIAQHNGDQKGGAKYTYTRQPVQLVYSEQCSSRSEALKREHVIKQMDRS